MVEHRCARCDALFNTPSDAKGKFRSYCLPCRRESKRLYANGLNMRPAPDVAARRKARAAAERERFLQQPRPCRRCGAEFTRWDSYPVTGTHTTHCHDCYLAVARERSYRSGAAKGPRQPPLPRRPGAPPKGKRWYEIRAAVIAEETHCGICGELVDKTLKGTHRRGPSVDHIEPLAFGGPAYDRTNLRLAHLGCNASAGQRQVRQRLDEVLVQMATLQARIAELEGRLFA